MPKFKAPNRNRVRPKTHSRPGYWPRPEAPRPKMSAADAIAMAEDMDLPDGAHFAMIGELMGADGEEAYMVGIEASLGAGGYE